MEEAFERHICLALNVESVEEAREQIERGRLFVSKIDIGIVQRLLRTHPEIAEPASFGTKLALKLLERIDYYLR